MKKTIAITVAAVLVAGSVLILMGNRKKMQEQTSSTSADSSEIVTTFKVKAERPDRAFYSTGVAQACSELNFVSEISGRVVEIYVDKGSRVSKGTPLLKIDSELLEADYKATLASYEALKKDEERFSRSFNAGGVTSQQLDNIRTQLIASESRLAVSKWKLDNAVVKAPMSGTVNNRFVETGSLIAPNVPLFEIVDDSRLKVVCNVPESALRMVRTGSRVDVSCSNGSSSWTGTVKNVGVKTDRGLNYPVEVSLTRDSGLKAGMFLKVCFRPEENEEAILIPRRAVVGSVLSADVYVIENGRAQRRPVTLGEMFGDRIEIVAGLSEGEEVVVAGLMNVSDGCAVRIADKQ